MVRTIWFLLLVLLPVISYPASNAVAQAEEGQPASAVQTDHHIFLPVAQSVPPSVPGAVVFESIMPPQSSAYGKSLDEWMALYWNWFIHSLLGGNPDQQVGNVLFVPLPANVEEVDGVLVGTCSLTIRPGTAFALPVNVVVGEIYEDGTEDDPADFPLDAFADGMTAYVSLDGKPLIDSDQEDVGKYLFGPAFFDDDIRAIGLAWVQGIGFIHSPLKKGVHTLELFSASDFFPDTQFDNTWTITVSPHAPLDTACEPPAE